MLSRGASPDTVPRESFFEEENNRLFKRTKSAKRIRNRLMYGFLKIRSSKSTRRQIVFTTKNP